MDATVSRALDPKRTRGLVWHTPGSGKTFTMIKAAELLFRSPAADKPTVLLMIDRNELEDQMLKNLAALGLGNLEHASSIARLNQLLRDDYRGIIITTIHKFRDMPANLNLRKNIYVLIDEAHRTTGGDLGNFLMAGLPNPTFIGFTGTPVDKTVYGRGTFKTFGCEDDQGYLHKYSIADSIEDGTTLPLYYQLAPNEMLVPHETLDKEFLSLAEAEGVADIEELNKILERAVNLKNFLKGKERIQKVAEFVVGHYLETVEPLGYKAFLVGVDREACALYKKALDKEFDRRGLPPEYSEVVYTGNNNDSPLLKVLFQNKMTEKAPAYLGLIERNFNDKDVDTLIEHFRDPERRKEFFKEYKEIEMLYEIISPDAFLRPFMDDYTTLSSIYEVVRKAYTKRVMVDRDFQRKTNALVQENIGGYTTDGPFEPVKIDGTTLELIKKKRGGDGTKVINLIKSIEKTAEENSDDPFLIAMAERARAVQESFEHRQTATADALAELLQEVERNEVRMKEQAEKGFDGLTFFVYRTLLDAKITNAEEVSRKIKAAFVEFPGWKRSEGALRELRKQVTFAIYAECENLDAVTRLVEELFSLLAKADRI